MTLLFYLGASYLFRGGMALVAYGLLALFTAVLLRHGTARSAAIPVAGLLLALLAWHGYVSQVPPERVRVTAVSTRQLEVQDGRRRYLLEPPRERLEVGMVLHGRFESEPMEENRKGRLAVLQLVEGQGVEDSLTELHKWKGRVQQRLIQRFGYDHGTLMASLVLGRKDQLGEERSLDMKALGILHILSISGFHFALIEGALTRMKLRRLVLPVILGYALLVGTVSAHRVLLNTSLKKMGRLCKRDVDSVTTLSAAMLLQSMAMPYLLFDMGFLLTYLSTFGILIFYPYLERHAIHFPRWIALPLSLSLSALALSLPVLLLFQEGVPWGLLAGAVLLMPVYVIVTYFSFLTVLFLEVPILLFLLEPFRSVFFDLSYHLGGFFGGTVFMVRLAHLKYLYAPLLLYAVLCIRFRWKRPLVLLAFLVLLSGMPLFTTVSFINKNGNPVIRVTHALRLYDIMDYRVADPDVHVLRHSKHLRLKGAQVEILPGARPRDVPEVRINGRVLRGERFYPYHHGMKIERRYIFIGERIYRIR